MYLSGLIHKKRSCLYGNVLGKFQFQDLRVYHIFTQFFETISMCFFFNSDIILIEDKTREFHTVRIILITEYGQFVS